MKITVIKGDITELDIDVIVNAAKTTLRGGSGVDGAIHSKAGPQLLEECIALDGCDPGDAKITQGYNLKAKYVIHAVGPIFFDGNDFEDGLLASCYKKSLQLAEENNCKIIAFPCISTGGYGFPSRRAANIVMKVLKKFKYKNIEEVILCCYMDEDFEIYNQLVEKNVFKRLANLFTWSS
jgi:O-acetyl-ADP-ribose deacetylase (regulator of RNase III)